MTCACVLFFSFSLSIGLSSFLLLSALFKLFLQAMLYVTVIQQLHAATSHRDSSATTEVMWQSCDYSNAAETRKEKREGGKVA